MASELLAAEQKRVRKIAENYRQRGYRVTIEPFPTQLPDFLQSFRPDVLAEGPDESVVIEIRSPKKAHQADEWTRLADAVRQHPGWRLELVLDNPLEQGIPKTITREQVEARLAEGRQLAQEGRLDAALLLTWSAAEAAMRLTSETNEVDLPDTRTETVISRLYMDGLLDREEYDALLRLMRLRNQVAHGFRKGRLSSASVKRLQAIALRLLQ